MAAVESEPDRLGRLSAALVRMHTEAGTGHLGSDLSCLPALLAVTGRLGADDRLVLSKGHSAAALYVSLAEVGLIGSDLLDSYYRDGTLLPGHTPANTFEAIPFATGSLGHGLSLACGLAYGKRLLGSTGTVYCVTSDGEWQEGSTWEGLAFALRHRLTGLVVLVDQNGWQALGRTGDISCLGDLAARLAGFPADVRELDGDDPAAIGAALDEPSDTVRVLVLDTTKGRGLEELEDTLASHYAVLPPDRAQRIAARLEAASHSRAER